MSHNRTEYDPKTDAPRGIIAIAAIIAATYSSLILCGWYLTQGATP